MTSIIEKRGKVDVDANLHLESDDFSMLIVGKKSRLEIRVVEKKSLRVAKLLKLARALKPLFSAVPGAIKLADLEATIFVSNVEVAQISNRATSSILTKLLRLPKMRVNIWPLLAVVVAQRRAEQSQKSN